MIAPALMQAGLPAIEDLTGQHPVSHTNFPQVLIVLAAMSGVALLAVAWVIFIRKKPRHRHRHHWTKHRRMSSNGSDVDAPEVRGRRKRSAHRPRNPTLAETHGLPPLRDDESPPPSY